MKTTLTALILIAATATFAKTESTPAPASTNSAPAAVTVSNIVTGTTAGPADAYSGATRKNKKKK